METGYADGFWCLVVALIAGIAFTLPALHILGLAAILWVARVLIEHLYWTIWA